MDKEKVAEKKPPAGLKPCCACPETRKLRDNCVLTSENGPDDCLELIEAHKNCLRELGFKNVEIIKTTSNRINPISKNYRKGGQT